MNMIQGLVSTNQASLDDCIITKFFSNIEGKSLNFFSFCIYLQCYPYYQLKSGKCIRCQDTKCSGCPNNAKVCEDCSEPEGDGYYGLTPAKTCAKCPANCSSCSYANKCLLVSHKVITYKFEIIEQNEHWICRDNATPVTEFLQPVSVQNVL